MQSIDKNEMCGYNYMDKTLEGIKIRNMSKAFKIVGNIIKYSFYFVILAINLIMLWRIFFSGDPAEIKPLIANEKLVSVYREQGSDLVLKTQKQKALAQSGRFSVTDCVFIPEAEQIQITVRYNNSTLRRVKEDFELKEVPDRKSEIFDVTVVKTTDLTPEDDEDNLDRDRLKEERFYPTSEAKTEYTRLYTYKKFVFDNIVLDDAVGLFVDIYYNGDMDYFDSPYDVLCIYDANMDMEDRALSRADKRALEKPDDQG